MLIYVEQEGKHKQSGQTHGGFCCFVPRIPRPLCKSRARNARVVQGSSWWMAKMMSRRWMSAHRAPGPDAVADA